MKGSVLILLCWLYFGALWVQAAHEHAVRKVEERSRYLVGPAEGARFEIVVIRWHLDHDLNSAAVLRFASIEVAELREMGLMGKYEPAHGYTASVAAKDDETGRFATSLVSGAAKEIITIRVLSWALQEDAHRARAAELIAAFKGSEGPIQSPQRNASSRPSSDDSPASETPSSLGPRG